MKTLRTVAAFAATTLLLAGCSGTPGTAPETTPPQQVTPKPAPETVVVTETESAAPAPASSPAENASQSSPTPVGQQAAAPERGVPGAPLAYPGAGGPVPSNARPVRSVKSTQNGQYQYAVFKAPSGNIGCQMSLGPEPLFECGVRSYTVNMVFGTGEMGMPKWMINILGGYAREQNDPPLYYDEVWPEGTVPAEVVQYGEVVHHGPYVCAVEESGVTCWDSQSGKGAWMERESTVFF